MRPPDRLRPGNRYSTPREPPETRGVRSLSDAAVAKVTLRATCRRCKHSALLWPGDLAAKLGKAYPLASVQRRLKCSQCGAKGETLRVNEVER